MNMLKFTVKCYKRVVDFALEREPDYRVTVYAGSPERACDNVRDFYGPDVYEAIEAVEFDTEGGDEVKNQTFTEFIEQYESSSLRRQKSNAVA